MLKDLASGIELPESRVGKDSSTRKGGNRAIWYQDSGDSLCSLWFTTSSDEPTL